ncbi:MAG: esterase/lipase family protein [Acidobacteriota bacterium]
MFRSRVMSLLLVLVLLGTMFVFPPIAGAAVRQNSYPIVLVGGLGVWGRDEVLGIKYWGALADIQENLKAYGYSTYTSSVGPVSSYYDRACELYAQTKGTRVDYGKGHADKYGHERYGRDYTGRGFCPDWGTNPVKIHILCHSMGGPTARCLVQLLEQGSDLEKNTPQDGMSELFTGNKHWVRSVMTISSPHDGTSLANALNGVPFLQQVLGGWISLWQGGNSFYDWKLDQWGLQRLPGESSSSYNSRVWASKIWTTNRDLANYDGSPIGAREFNAWVKAQPDVYYFSWATKATWKELFTGKQIPNLDMNPIWTAFGYHMGAYTDSIVTRDWWPNDGVVNTNSMDGPSTDTIITYSGSPQIGKWNYLGLRSGWDHSDVIGFTLWPVTGWFRQQADLLGTLPQ